MSDLLVTDGATASAVAPTATDIAWAAGLFEGEGHWRWRSGNGGGVRSVDSALSSTDRDVVEKFMAVVGFGAIRPNQPANPRAQLQWRWASGRREDIKRMAEMFLPYLGERRAQRAREILAVPAPVPQHLRGQQTHCRHGHIFDAANTTWYRGTNGRQWRQCKACHRAGARDRARERNGVTPDRYRVKDSGIYQVIRDIPTSGGAALWLHISRPKEQ